MQKFIVYMCVIYGIKFTQTVIKYNVNFTDTIKCNKSHILIFQTMSVSVTGNK